MATDIHFAPATIHQDFIAAAQKHPDNTAVWTEDGSISYLELDNLSNSFAHWLINNQHAPGQRVALILSKSIDSIVAIMGTLKAGNTYVPLGVTWPGNRLNTIISNGDFKLILQETAIEDVEAADTPVLLTESEEWSRATTATEHLSTSLPTVSSEDLAYILYTSGSTGIPKGVCVSHSAAHYFPHWARQEFSVDSSHRIASIAPFTFDLSTFDLFTGLASGACIYIVPEKYKMFPPRLSRFLEQHQITTMYAVPSTLSLMVLNGHLDKRDFSHFKTVLFAGEVFPIEVCRLFRQYLPQDVQYYNLYGPTETNVCTYFDASQLPATDEPLPIGLPLPGTSLFLDPGADDAENSGELCVAGPAVMSGYWGKPNKDASCWVKVKENAAIQAYRTGDIAYQREDGHWIYKGRADKMVKIWGYRVELGEIENGMLKHVDVEQCAVVKRERKDKLGEELVAFVVPKYSDCGNKLDHTVLFKHCKTLLPHYMLPAHIYDLESFPLNNSGKIDRLKLEAVSREFLADS